MGFGATFSGATGEKGERRLRVKIRNKRDKKEKRNEKRNENERNGNGEGTMKETRNERKGKETKRTSYRNFRSTSLHGARPALVLFVSL